MANAFIDEFNSFHHISSYNLQHKFLNFTKTFFLGIFGIFSEI
ncbi:hypothetical protein CSUNSWCD_431 [Campylobacter showae CSUNSWCD]|uniref:Uncharacterized protein n=1 Tax=Campylobacter showae CSUNSWCD TaxID=1244083 RepID=M5ISH5_9BACT|nr:hypothetical protein CSUNSWCD_431 [Campylobacter showae CSUNSWCD]